VTISEAKPVVNVIHNVPTRYIKRK